jgi:hypothetical protein
MCPMCQAANRGTFCSLALTDGGTVEDPCNQGEARSKDEPKQCAVRRWQVLERNRVSFCAGEGITPSIIGAIARQQPISSATITSSRNISVSGEG